MSEERIEITINKDGSIEANTKGFKGAVCEEELEKLLGREWASVNKTDEYYQKRVTQNVQEVRR